MALPNSGQLSFNDVRTEMSQSQFSNYAIGGWAWGYNADWSTGTYAPVNLLGIHSSKRPAENNQIILQNFSMSFWYGYNHTAYVDIGQTGSLYCHADAGSVCNPSTMIILDAGTTSKPILINISGSSVGNGFIEVYYGKPWKNNGASGAASTIITSMANNIADVAYSYEYVYNPDVGRYIYILIVENCF